MFQLQLFFLLHCDEWDRVVALPRHRFVTRATLLQLNYQYIILLTWIFIFVHIYAKEGPYCTLSFDIL